VRHSLYWDDFSNRIDETVNCIRNNKPIPVKRVAIFVTNRCNFRCKYCNGSNQGPIMSSDIFDSIIKRYPNAIIHITGGEPSIVPWLYPYLIAKGDKYKFHLNTNGFITPPAKHIKRLKVSLDSYDSEYWNKLVGKENAFETVVKNIKEASELTTTSITFTLNKQNYRQTVDFSRFVKKEFPKLYAVFFSVYKGYNLDFSIDNKTASNFFDNVLPILKKELPEESLNLICETINEKRRLIQGVRFEQKLETPCYLSMSERVFDPLGNESFCSHLFRDKIILDNPKKHDRCRYGCNQRLVQFNNEVEERLK
jgi:MoaA/NifB/PqqE/SkfB family radical SAM enzyme